MNLQLPNVSNQAKAYGIQGKEGRDQLLILGQLMVNPCSPHIYWPMRSVLEDPNYYKSYLGIPKELNSMFGFGSSDQAGQKSIQNSRTDPKVIPIL